MEKTKGLGEARMMGIFGKSGAGKSWMAAYVITGFAKNKDMGILVLDPQGELAKNFQSARELRLPFHEMLKYACGRELHIVRSDQLKLDPRNLRDVALLTRKFFEYEELFRTSPDKYRDFLDELYDKILNTRFDDPSPINPVTYYLYAHDAIVNGEAEKIGKDVTLDTLIPTVWAKFLDEAKKIIDSILTTQEPRNRAKRSLDEKKKSEIWINKFRSFLNLFDTTQGISTDSIVDLLLNQRSVVIIDLSEVGNRVPWINEKELQALFISMILQKIRERAEKMYKESNSLANVLIAMDEAHNYVGTYSDVSEEVRRLREQLVKNVKETRKYGIGWLFITQTTVDFDKEIYRQLHDYFFLYGLGVGADLQHMKEVVPKEFIEVYKSLPNPKQTNNYWAMHVGSLSVLNTATSATFIRLPSPEEFLRLNFNMTLEDLKKKEEEDKKRGYVEEVS